MATLDRTRVYGEITSNGGNGARFIQDGLEFDIHGNEVVGSPPVPTAPQLFAAIEVPPAELTTSS